MVRRCAVANEVYELMGQFTQCLYNCGDKVFAIMLRKL